MKTGIRLRTELVNIAKTFAHHSVFRLTPHASRLTTAASITLCVMLSACGFHLRGQAKLPFESIYVQAASTSPFANQLRRAIQNGTGTQLSDDPKRAQATLQIISEVPERAILSLSGSGRVRELQLRYRVTFRVYDGKNRDLLPANEILVRRDLTYNDTDVLGKEQEEALLYRDMQSDAVQQLVRRLEAVKVAS
jgi:LPS-assembly lipoprotein